MPPAAPWLTEASKPPRKRPPWPRYRQAVESSSAIKAPRAPPLRSPRRAGRPLLFLRSLTHAKRVSRSVSSSPSTVFGLTETRERVLTQAAAQRSLQAVVARARAERGDEQSSPVPRTEGLGHRGGPSLPSQSSTGQEARAKQMSRSPVAITSLVR